ncbi:hypothetical protein MLD38_028501 [Melastoma candidum]|uniref:Uncharacterized protein n=1 Tax=Melastoma candidum TaxID=119954 RepID=A0ACB9N3J9_9MYRT|nr:hypothetical protein MLD38_028501 [Melastoma candidum]
MEIAPLSRLERQSLFETGDCFVNEAMEQDCLDVVKAPYIEMYRMIEEMKNRKLELVLKWDSSSSSKMKESGSDLELKKLHWMQFVVFLQKGGRDEALSYARTHLAPFASSRMVEMQKRPWAAFCGLEGSSTPHTLSCCSQPDLTLLALLKSSPLSIVLEAFPPSMKYFPNMLQALPQLLKFIDMMVGKKHEWQSMKQLLESIELDDELQFHSIFVCPVSKEQATDDNPPKLTRCGHVLCKQSIRRCQRASPSPSSALTARSMSTPHNAGS